MAGIPFPYLSISYIFSGVKSSGTCSHGSSTNIDLYIDPAKWNHGVFCNGAKLITQNAAYGDSLKIQCVDKDNITGYGAGTVLGQYADWYVDPSASIEATIDYADIIPPYFYMRLIYTSVGSSDVNAYINWFLHKIP